MGEIVNAGALRTANKIYVGSLSRPSYDLSRQRVYGTAKHTSRSVQSWWNAPETKRKKRIARYKYYAYEGKVKASIKKGFRWIKSTCSKLVRRF